MHAELDARPPNEQSYSFACLSQLFRKWQECSLTNVLRLEFISIIFIVLLRLFQDEMVDCSGPIITTLYVTGMPLCFEKIMLGLMLLDIDYPYCIPFCLSNRQI